MLLLLLLLLPPPPLLLRLRPAFFRFLAFGASSFFSSPSFPPLPLSFFPLSVCLFSFVLLSYVFLLFVWWAIHVPAHLSVPYLPFNAAEDLAVCQNGLQST